MNTNNLNVDQLVKLAHKISPAQPTPAPWKVVSDKRTCSLSVKAGNHGTVCSIIRTSKASNAEKRANAVLIASAPAMKNALVLCAEALEAVSLELSLQHHSALRDLISKARISCETALEASEKV